jgi:hypothetical protein
MHEFMDIWGVWVAFNSKLGISMDKDMGIGYSRRFNRKTFID